jgi:REP element-mobilizing transposase RayT
MTRIARIVAPGPPHHVTQRGNRAERSSSSPETISSTRTGSRNRAGFGVDCWAYCLAPNHVHLILLVQATQEPRRDVRVLIDWIKTEAQSAESRLEDELKGALAGIDPRPE